VRKGQQNSVFSHYIITFDFTTILENLAEFCCAKLVSSPSDFACGCAVAMLS
jgi:hypothetical protein